MSGRNELNLIIQTQYILVKHAHSLIAMLSALGSKAMTLELEGLCLIGKSEREY